MGIFSFLGKKDRREDAPLSEIDAPRRRPEDRPARSNTAANAERTASSQIVQRDAARETALKIDKIESEMSSELSRPQSIAGSPSVPGRSATPQPSKAAKSTTTTEPGDAFLATLPAMGMSTDFMLGGDYNPKDAAIPATETAPVIDEAAILFANDQNEMVEAMLLGAIDDGDLGESTVTAWWMLFDLYQITDKQLSFENLALRYAAKFETSPPTWVTPTQDGANDPRGNTAGAGTTVAFSGKLDESIQKQLDRAQKLGETNPLLRLEFSRIGEVTPEGCALMLTALKKLQRSGCDLMLISASEFATKVRATLEVGRRDETEAPWLLLLEILQLLNRQQDFEEASIDYCVTFEVSPPAFIMPKSTVTSVIDTDFDQAPPPNVFSMPSVVDGKTGLIDEITRFAKQHNPAIIDCSRLTRVDFSAAGQLLSGLAPLIGDDRVIELHNVNQLVTALFNVMGLREIARILPRKQ